MTSNLDIEQKEEEYREAQAMQMAYEAAEMVAEGDSRDAAVEAVKNQYRELEDASENELIRDDLGIATHVNDTAHKQEPRSTKKEAQIRAIQQDLLHAFQ